MGGDSTRRAGRAQEQQPRARGRDKQCAGPRGWTASARRSGGKGARAGRAHVARQLRDLESVFQGKNIGQDVPTK